MFEQPETLLKCMNYGARLASQSNEGIESYKISLKKNNRLH